MRHRINHYYLYAHTPEDAQDYLELNKRSKTHTLHVLQHVAMAYGMWHVLSVFVSPATAVSTVASVAMTSSGAGAPVTPSSTTLCRLCLYTHPNPHKYARTYMYTHTHIFVYLERNEIVDTKHRTITRELDRMIFCTPSTVVRA